MASLARWAQARRLPPRARARLPADESGRAIGGTRRRRRRRRLVRVEGDALPAALLEPEGEARRAGSSTAGEGVQAQLAAVFLPAGYPSSVSPDYANWLPWHLASLLCRKTLEVLTTQSLVVAVGLGSSPAAVPLAAAAKWVLKDGVGSVGTLVSGTLGGQRFDEDPKRYWALSSALEDLARALELLTPAFPAYFLPLAGGAAFVRSLALVGRNSLLNGTIMRHLGAAENFADVRAKLEVQGRLLTLLSLPIGLLLFRAAASAAGADVGGTLVGVGGDIAPEHASALPVLLAYASVFCVHNLCCWRAAVALELPTLNRRRLGFCAQQYIARGDVPTPAEAAAAEGVYADRLPEGAVQIGAPLSAVALGRDEVAVLADACLPEDEDAADDKAIAAPYVVGWDVTRGGAGAVLRPGAVDPCDAREAALAAAALAAAGAGASPRADDAEAARRAAARGRALEPAFAAALQQAGWRADAVQLGAAPRAAVMLGPA